MMDAPPFDGRTLRAEASELAFPRAAGSDGDLRAIELVADRLEGAGAQVERQWFSYDLRPAQRALRAVLVGAAVMVGAAGAAVASHPLAGMGLLVAAIVPASFFLAWSPWLEALYRRDGPVRTANVEGRWCRGVPRMTLILVAHHDSKSQSLSLPVRSGLTGMALAGLGVLVAIAVGGAVAGSSAGSRWPAAAVSCAVAAAVVALSAMRSGNLSPGGVDNAGSLAILLELARRLPGALPDQVELVALSPGAEEDHLVGAMRWLDRHAGELSGRAVLCLNFDGAGAPGRPVLIERYGFGRRFSAQLSAAARRAAAELGLEPRGILMLPGVGIDAIPFAHRGIPCLTLSSGSLGRATMSVHTARDRAEHLDPRALAEVANLAFKTMTDLARGAAPPVPLTSDR